MTEVATDFKEEWRVGNKSIILYSGNLGSSQPVEAFVRLARQLAASSDWALVIVGKGSHARLVERRTRSFSNVVFRPPVPQDQLGTLFSIADWGLVLLNEASAGSSVPSKAYNLLAAGVPLLAMVPEASDIARLIDEDRVGMRFSSCNMPLVLSEVTSMPQDVRAAFSQRALETSKRYTAALADEFVQRLPEAEERPHGP